MNNESIKIILKKLVNVGNPGFLLHLLNDVGSFVKAHQNGFPNDGNTTRSYLVIGNDTFLLSGRLLSSIEKYPESCCLIYLSKEDYIKLTKLLGMSTKEVDIKKLMKLLRKVDNIRNYKLIMEVISTSFSTNMSIIQLCQLVRQQI